LSNTAKVLEYIDAFIAQQEMLIKKAEAARDFFASFEAVYTKPFKYSVPSRSGGKPHIVTVDMNEINCSCPAGGNGRKCWAMTGIGEAVLYKGSANLGKNGGFHDNRFEWRTWERIDD
jgi:hypothetical protein